MLVKTEIDLLVLPIGDATAGILRAPSMVVIEEGMAEKACKGVGSFEEVGAAKIGGGLAEFCWGFSMKSSRDM